ncbi:unnamed protein product [Allacma fusca]|uniref:Uncharacterized protein n=1 Tax=Allacma fusca TaxID=39272 RepID=A0A8J2LL05_9HEXA|nr:unnamed protein product [Allacma fusca]
MVLEISASRSLIQVPDLVNGRERPYESRTSIQRRPSTSSSVLYSKRSPNSSEHYASSNIKPLDINSPKVLKNPESLDWLRDFYQEHSGTSFCRIKLPAVGMFEEQEISVFVFEGPTESDYEEIQPYECASPYESIYSELVYSPDSGCECVSSCNGGAPVPESHSPNLFPSTKYPNSHSEWDSSPGPTETTQVKPRWQERNDNYVNKFLPPIPDQARRPSKEISGRISTIARSAGRKLTKKMLSIRRLSRTSRDSVNSTPTTVDSSGSVTPSGIYSGGSGNDSTYSDTYSFRNTHLPPSPSSYSSPNTIPNGSSNLMKPEYDEFEDSDFYDSDHELIRNFVSAVQPIYSMEEEPLYQFYTYGISSKPDDTYQPIIPVNLGLTLDMLVPNVGQRTLWCHLPEVANSGILGILSDKQKQLQEAIFEILTSEVSYLKSLQVLISLFYDSPELTSLLSYEQIKHLFGNICQVRDCSQNFLADLLAKWKESWYIQEIGHVIKDYATKRFPIYIDYCRNKPHQDRTLSTLRLSNSDFVHMVRLIEENPKCQLLKMDSFLLLPMQRITRIPLLVNAVLQRTLSQKEKAHCEDALQALTSLVLECNEAARESQNAEETATIVDNIELPRDYGKEALGNFVMKGEFMKNPFDPQGTKRMEINWTLRKSKPVLYWLFIFSRQLVITKKKSSSKYKAMDIIDIQDCRMKVLPYLTGASKDFKHFFMLHFNRRDTVYFLGARAQSEVDRWIKKLDQLQTYSTRGTTSPSNLKERTVQAIFPFKAQREDELSFQQGDILLVSEMQRDGWYFGYKKDSLGERGWFPGNYCCEC